MVLFMNKNYKKQIFKKNEYIIEKILKTEGNQAYVKWRGYDSSFNSWVDKNTVTKYLQKNHVINLFK